MQLTIKEVLDREIMHYASADLTISSRYNKIYVKKDKQEYTIQLPNDGLKGVLSFSRLARRLLRLDKCNVVPVGDDLVIIRQGKVYHYCGNTRKLRQTLELKNCHNVLHQSVAIADNNEIFFGEYGYSPTPTEVPVYRSLDGGKSWETIFAFQKAKIRHVHGCYWDPYEEKLWVFTGDFKNECHILCTDRHFENIEWVGNGQQIYRACNAFFEEDTVHWIMDSPLRDNYHIRLDRKSRTIEKMSTFPGPVWYIKRLTDNYYLAATTQEIGPGVHDQYAHFFVSKNLENWEDVYQFKHDGFPKNYFKFGIIGFADGLQSSQSFYIFFEAIKGLDGKTVLCKLQI